MTDIRRALVRKFGPLPAWAWALIGGIGLYLFRHSSSLAAGKVGGTGTATTDATSPSTSDQTQSGTGGDNGADDTRQDPVTLQPGEAVYDPNTGHLFGTAPEQQPTDAPDPQTPVTLDPGQTVYDPSRGGVFGTPAAKKAAGKKPTTKRTKKPKAQHAKKKAAKQPGGKHKPRGTGRLRNPLARSKPEASARKGRHETPKAPPSRTRTPAAPPASRQRTRAPAPQHPSMRQRPAAPKVVHAQKVVPHPAREARAPARHEPPKRRRK